MPWRGWRCSRRSRTAAQTAEHQIPIWCSQPLSLLCSVNDAVNVLPCSTCAYLTIGVPDLRCFTRTALAVRLPPGYGSGGWGSSPGGQHTRQGVLPLDALRQLGERLVTEGEPLRWPVDRLSTWRPNTCERGRQQPSVVERDASVELARHLEDDSRKAVKVLTKAFGNSSAEIPTWSPWCCAQAAYCESR